MILSLILDFDKNKVIKKTLKIVEHPKYQLKKQFLKKFFLKFITYFLSYSKTKLF